MAPFIGEGHMGRLAWSLISHWSVHLLISSVARCEQSAVFHCSRNRYIYLPPWFTAL